TASRRRLAGKRERFAVFCARLAGKDATVDQAGGEDMAIAIHHLCAIGQPVIEQRGAEIGDNAIFDEQSAHLVIAAGGVDQARIDEGGAAHLAPPCPVRGSFGRLRASASSTAMRTATPISTCS